MNNTSSVRIHSYLKPLIGRVAWLVIFNFIILSLAACTTIEPFISSVENLDTENIQTPTVQNVDTLPEVDVTFRVEVPPNTPEDQQVFIDILDEVTGLALNVQSHPMIQDQEQQFVVTIPFKLGTVIKYRYNRQTPTIPVEEHTSDGRQVRYRLYHVQAPGSIVDHVSRWTDTEFVGTTGRIMGEATDIETGQPIPNLLVAAGGHQTFTSADGSFLIEGLTPGTHNLVGYALDGKYHTFQQGAVVAPDSTTPAPISLSSAPLVSITFDITAPENTIPAIPIRFAGNLYQLGNTFGDLSAGFNTLASRMPIVTALPEHKYIITLQLPEGADIRYLYTLGDGFWNTEKNVDGEPVVRQLIVPPTDSTVSDLVESWSSGSDEPVAFDINSNTSTPPTDFISIQFNPLIGWTEPLPAWKLAEDRWVYVLNNPLTFLDTLQYRVCRNDQCSSADDARTMGPNSTGLTVDISESSRTTTTQVDAWAWLESPTDSFTYTLSTVVPRGDMFMAGVEIQPSYHPSWDSRFSQMYADIQSNAANWVILTPTWSFTRNSPPILEIVPGKNPLWFDMEKYIQEGHSSELNVALKPSINISPVTEDWWQEAERDFSWWLIWFEQYRNFLLHHATMAARNEAQALIIDGQEIAPALPNGILPDGSLSGVPVDAESRWRTMITDIRSRYNGPIIWAMSYEQATSNPPPFLDAFDQLYILFDEPLTANYDPSQAELEFEAARLFDEGLLPFQAQHGLPMIIGLAYPSADGAATACLPDPEGGCLKYESLSRPNLDIPSISRDLQEQVDIYSALLNVINQRDWIDGFITTGYYPPANLQDKSNSVHGKPTETLLGNWFSQVLASP